MRGASSNRRCRGFFMKAGMSGIPSKRTHAGAEAGLQKGLALIADAHARARFKQRLPLPKLLRVHVR